MAYATGTATGIDDMLTDLATVLAANGWTVHEHNSASRGLNFESAAGDMYCIQADPNNGAGSNNTAWIQTVAHEGFVPGCVAANQTNRSNIIYSECPEGPITKYFFFIGSDWCYITVEISAAQYRHFGVGILDKFGTYTGGQFAYGTIWNQGYNYQRDSNYCYGPFDCNCQNAPAPPFDVKCEIEGNKWYGGYVWNSGPPGGNWRSEPVSVGHGVRAGMWRDHFERSPNTFNGQNILIPIAVSVDRVASQLYSFIGNVPRMKSINMTTVNPEDILTFGDDNWMCFPIASKVVNDINTGPPSSGMYGVAFLKD